MLRNAGLYLLVMLLCTAVRGQKTGTDTVFVRRAHTTGERAYTGKNRKTPFSSRDYLVIRHGDTGSIDTTLTYAKWRTFNRLHKDLFEYLSFHNTGQAYQRLALDTKPVDLMPGAGFTGKRFSFMPENEVPYYRVPTPASQLYYKTAIQQGQFLHSFLTANLTRHWNLSIGYRGLRSLGLYRHSLASKENFRFTATYDGSRYGMKFHYVSHHFINEENGGLSDTFLGYYLDNNPDYTDRGRIETLYTDAESVLRSRRIFLENSYRITRDSARRDLSVQAGHRIVFGREYYLFDQQQAQQSIGTAWRNTIADSTAFQYLDNALYLRFKFPYLPGKWHAEAGYRLYTYGNRTAVYLSGQNIPPLIRGTAFSLLARWYYRYGKFRWDAGAGNLISENGNGQYLRLSLGYYWNDDYRIHARAEVSSRYPDFIYRRYQSDYMRYQWYNTLKPENTRLLGMEAHLGKWGDGYLGICQKDFYTYFDENQLPAQYSGILGYIKTYWHSAVSKGKFTWDFRGQYQQVVTGAEVLRLPRWLGESALYYSDYVFKGKPMYVQAGFNVKYFSPFLANEFNAVLNEFYLQNQREIGGKPLLDVFINGKVQTMRLYLKAENIQALWGSRLLVTPSRPYRDFAVRFGVVWNFFQ